MLKVSPFVYVYLSGFGDLEVAGTAFSTQDRGVRTRPKVVRLLGWKKIPQHAFLRRGPMS